MHILNLFFLEGGDENGGCKYELFCQYCVQIPQMASILNDYLGRRLGIVELQDELQTLIKKYNEHSGRFMFIYASDINKGRKGEVDISLTQDDFYNIQDILRESKSDTIDFYIETPGGSGEAAEEIARFLRKKFKEVNFIIAGESKSAGTILVLSGDNIYMTETGSLGPIDAQVKIGRSQVSAHDYKEWVDLKRDEAQKNGRLNPFDAIMVAQISPGEIHGVINSLEFAKDLVKSWLEEYKFKNWNTTATQKQPVTQEMKKERAKQVAEMFANHTTWRTHGRSLKIEDLQDVLVIEAIDNDEVLKDIVYRIKTVIRLIFDGSSAYKLFYLDDSKLTKTYTVGSQSAVQRNPLQPGKQIETANVNLKCPKCGKQHKIVGFIGTTKEEIANFAKNVNPNINNDVLTCDKCNFAMDLKAVKNEIETQTKKTVIFK